MRPVTLEMPPSRRWLYSLGDVSWVDFTGQTPFLRAALSGDTTVMRLLLEHGADQGAVVARELVARGFTHVRSHRDLAGHERMTEARWH